MKPNSPLKIALQKKGRLVEDSLQLLKTVGLEFDHYENKLLTRVRNFDLEILFLRDDDIPQYVQNGICDLGIVGLNVLGESPFKLEIVEKLGFGICQLAIAVPKKSSYKKVSDLKNCRLATSYPQLLKKFLQQKKISAQIIKLSGCVEIAPTLNIADAICDLVSTGTTLQLNGLKQIATVFESQAVLIKNPRPLNFEKTNLLEQLRLRIQASLQGQNNKYLMMNAPKKLLPKIIKILPSLKSPTIMPLASTGLVAIHSVVEEVAVWSVIEQLKKAGASGILVLPIENLLS